MYMSFSENQLIILPLREIGLEYYKWLRYLQFLHDFFKQSCIILVYFKIVHSKETCHH